MKRFLKKAFLLFVVSMGLGIVSQSYATKETMTDSANAFNVQQVLESFTVFSDSSNTLESVSGKATASINVLKDTPSIDPIQELPTTLWDIEDENEVKYDSDNAKFFS